jgi:hypothetical protein
MVMVLVVLKIGRIWAVVKIARMLVLLRFPLGRASIVGGKQ